MHLSAVMLHDTSNEEPGAYQHHAKHGEYDTQCHIGPIPCVRANGAHTVVAQDAPCVFGVLFDSTWGEDCIGLCMGLHEDNGQDNDNNGEDNGDHDSSPKNKCTRYSILARTYTPLLM